jgi:uncharacterized protein
VIARALALALLWAGLAASAEVPVPPLTARVTDLTATLDAGQHAALEARLAAFERAKGSQVVVLIVPTTQPETIEQYGIRVASAWKIGRGGTIDDGAILLVAKEDRALRIEVGYGLEGALPDAIAKRIIEETIVPRFRSGDFYGGISDGVERIIGVIEGEPLPSPSRRDFGGGGGVPPDGMLGVLVVIPMLVGGIVRLAHNRFTGAAVAGGLAGLIGWWWLGASVAVLVLALFCFAFVLGTGNASRRGGWSSGGSWGGGGYSGGGGGFSGGGGGFGGGGASGRW